MFLISWLFDKAGYMPKITIDTTYPFPCTQKEYVAPECEKPVKKIVKRTVKKKAK